MKKFIDNKGGIKTIIAYTVVLIPLIFIILLGFTWTLRDNTYDYVDTTLRTAVDITTKKGLFDNNTKLFIKGKLDKIYLPADYEVVIAKQSFTNIGGTIPTPTNINSITTSAATSIKYSVGDVVYIQFKIINDNKEPLSSRLIRLIGGGTDIDRMIIVEQGMVEVNGQ